MVSRGTNFVRNWFIIWIGFLMLGGICVLPVIEGIKEKTLSVAVRKKGKRSGSGLMTLNGVRLVDEEDGRRWDIRASKVRFFRGKGFLELKDIRVVLTEPYDQRRFSLRGRKGRFYTATKELNLEGEVLINTDDGYIMMTRSLKYIHFARLLITSWPVYIKGPDLELTGKGLILNMEKERVQIREDVRSLLYPESLRRIGQDLYIDKSTPSGRPILKRPIRIRADHLELDRRLDMAMYRGNVKAVHGDSVLYCSKLIARFDSRVKRVLTLEAEGGVRLQSPEGTVTAHKALMDMGSRVIRLTGEPVLRRGRSLIKGKSVIYDMDQKRSTVKGGDGVPVTTTFFPADRPQAGPHQQRD